MPAPNLSSYSMNYFHRFNQVSPLAIVPKHKPGNAIFDVFGRACNLNLTCLTWSDPAFELSFEASSRPGVTLAFNEYQSLEYLASDFTLAERRKWRVEETQVLFDSLGRPGHLRHLSRLTICGPCFSAVDPQVLSSLDPSFPVTPVSDVQSIHSATCILFILKLNITL